MFFLFLFGNCLEYIFISTDDWLLSKLLNASIKKVGLKHSFTAFGSVCFGYKVDNIGKFLEPSFQ